ncbi:hypothetical protein EYB26_009220 [Talaromyces marneffei]|uniref:uncharacterized protein n=1 Tax=Talaromyces marneffei TaxID=37727 RepID=UPI0012A994D6|nr:uncharacterized protein EYB26_009220 [Talaromyces marneffei]QGA21509.1 hypothetical protein EYB26_009220 [Talaromyces marneffei]
MSSLADYLAKNYLTADPQPERPKKKRKKNKHHDPLTSGGDGLIIADDDPPSLRAAAGDLKDNEYDENSPYILDSSASRALSAEFKKKKKSSWKVVGDGGHERAAAGQDEADAILASAAAESAARLQVTEADDAPTIEGEIIQDMEEEEEEEEEDGGQRMESGARAGLQTAAQTAAMVAAQERRKKAELAAFQASVKQQQQEGGGETIYRDASGRIINVAMKRAEARKAAEEAAKAEQAAKDALMGDVQRQAKEERMEQLRSARAMPLARTIEDEDLNEELRQQDRWNDPAAQFLTTKKAGVSKTGRPLYKGGFAPNRYGIRPGHRWDGVDRGNGFEKEWFQARARKDRIRDLEYEWQMDE